MKSQLQQRLQILRNEFDAGQEALKDVEARQANLRDTLFRISGAIQVLEELLRQTDEVSELKTENDFNVTNTLDNHHQVAEYGSV